MSEPCHVMFENAEIVESGEGCVTYLENGKYSHVIFDDEENTATIGEGDSIEEAKQQAEDLVNEQDN